MKKNLLVKIFSISLISLSAMSVISACSASNKENDDIIHEDNFHEISSALTVIDNHSNENSSVGIDTTLQADIKRANAFKETKMADLYQNEKHAKRFIFYLSEILNRNGYKETKDLEKIKAKDFIILYADFLDYERENPADFVGVE